MVWNREREDSIPGFGKIKFLILRDFSAKKHFPGCYILPWEEWEQFMRLNSSLSPWVIYTDEQWRKSSAEAEMHAQASCEFCGENSAAVSLPDKWGDLTRADPVLTPEEVSLGTEPRRELHIGWRGFEHTKRHSPLAIFRHQLGLYSPSCVTETHVNRLTQIGLLCLSYNKKSGGRESRDDVKKFPKDLRAFQLPALPS